jgi:uncharacterized protein (DUF2141 family)
LGAGGRSYLARADSVGYFSLDGLLAGRYAVWAFVDRDGDGVRDDGSLDPFVNSESYGRHDESIVLESGQIIEALQIRCR